MSTATKKQELPAGHSRGSAYERYKKTTRAFRDSLQKLVNSKMHIVSISDLAVASERVLEMSGKGNLPKKNKLKDLQSLLTNLDETIVLREAVGATYSDGMDDGHCYIIQVLKYSRVVLGASLANLQSSQDVDKNEEDDSGAHKNKGRYGVLGDDDEEDNENLGDEQSFELPPRPVDKDYSIEKDLIIGSLAFQAKVFFLAAENLFSIVADSYETLKQNMDDLNESNLGYQEVNHKSVVHLLQTTAAVNLALENMRYLETSFYLESDYFEDIYDVFAVVVFQEKIAELEAIMGPEILAKDPAACLDIASGCVLFGFIVPDGTNHLRTSVASRVHSIFERAKIQPNFCKEELQAITEICVSICASAETEEHPGHHEHKSSDEFSSSAAFRKEDGPVAKTIDVPTLQWLNNYTILGGKSGIMHTFARLLKFKLEQKFELNPDEEGSLIEHTQPLRSTREIMDTVFRNDALFHLSALSDGLLSDVLPVVATRPHYSACMSFFCEFGEDDAAHSEFDKDEEDHFLNMNIFSAAFTVHALVYAIFVLQGDDRLKRLAVVSQVTIGKFATQVKEVNDTDFMSCLKTYDDSAFVRSSLLNKCFNELLLNYRKDPLQSQLLRNPLLSGSFILTTTFVSNMKNLYCWSDALFQARIALHLNNGLRQRELIDSIEVLELLDRALISDERIWPTGKPTLSGLLKCFIVAAGYSSRVANLYIDYLSRNEASSAAPKDLPTNGCVSEYLSREQLVVMEHIEALLYIRMKHQKVAAGVDHRAYLRVSPASKSLLNRDFPDTHTSEKNVVSELGAMCTRQADWLTDKIASDHAILSLNWLKVGHLLDEFVNQLFDCIGVSPLVQEFISRRGSFSSPFHESLERRNIGNKFLMAWLFCELEYKDDKEKCAVSKKAASFMTEYFTSVATRQTVTFF